MSVLFFLEGIRTPFLNTVFSALTNLGDEAVLLIVGMLIFWCIDKKWGYRMMTTLFFGLCINQSIKILVRMPRPWQLDENLSIVEAARERAMDYSFPSGHTQLATMLYGSVAGFVKSGVIKVLCVLTIAIVAFSRLYLGVHTPLDVIAGAVIGGGLVLFFMPAMKKIQEKKGSLLSFFFVPAIASLLCIVSFVVVKDDVADTQRYADSVKNICCLCGGSWGLLVGYLVETKWIRFSARATLPVQIAKFVAGAVVVFAGKVALKKLLYLIFPGTVFCDTIRYFLMVLLIIVVVPAFFPKET